MSEAHWTSADPKDFLYRIASDFVMKIEQQMKSKKLTQSQLATMLDKNKTYISQILANPGNLTLRTMIVFARTLGLKVSVVAYDDDDAANVNGPIHSEIFELCWVRSGKPRDMFAFAESAPTAVAFVADRTGPPYEIDFSELDITAVSSERHGVEITIDRTASRDSHGRNVAITSTDDSDFLEQTTTQETSHA